MTTQPSPATTSAPGSSAANASALAAAMAEATAEIEARPGGGATSGEGVGGGEGTGGTGELQGDSRPQGEKPPELPNPADGNSDDWWLTEEGRTAHAQETEQATARRLADQRRDLTQQTAAWQAQQSRRAALTTELEELERINPTEFAQRLQRDPEAASWAFEKAAAAGADPIAAARQLVGQEHEQLIRTRLPNVVAAFEALPQEEQAKYADPSTSGGFYSFVFDHGRKEGREEAIVVYEKSPAFLQKLQLAKEEGATEALRRGGQGSAPPATGAPPSSPTRIESGNPWADAAADAAQSTGRPIDPTQIRGGQRRRSA